MNDRTRSWLVYTAKCVAGAILVYIIAQLCNYKDTTWALISVLLVLSPDGKDALPLAITRIKANVVGAVVAVLMLLVMPPNMWMIALGLAVTMSFCYLFKLDAGIRSALAATIIIMLHNEGKHLWDTALERVISVLAGCVLALLITFAFHFRIHPGEAVKEQSQDA